jgi:ribose transport system ATP-binding protein
MKNISKAFSGVTVLDNVKLEIYQGEVHSLMGENGAGKSTLMKILMGIYQKNSGDIFLADEKGDLAKTEIETTRQSQHLGISMIFQELNLLDNLSIAENIFLGREPLTKLNTINWGELMEDSRKLLQEVELDLDPRTKVGDLSLAQKQTVEIAKCLSFNSRLIIMDEPTTSLTDRETKTLFKLIQNLKSKGVSIIYISHRMEEIFTLSDRITVFRDGRYIGTLNAKETDKNMIIKMMVGRDLKLENNTTSFQTQNRKNVLQIKDLNSNKLLKNINLNLYEGEILGIFGLVGAGRTELAKAIFGIDKIDSGDIFINGEKVRIRNPKDAINCNIALVPEDRKKQGLILGLNVRKNMVLAKLRRMNGIHWRNDDENSLTEKYIRELSIATTGVEQTVQELSGGNQQKIVIAKWLATSPKILILDEPTRGIDIGAKTEIYNLMNKLAQQGMSIIMISSELQEILNVSNRVLVMHEGKITLNTPMKGLTQEKIMHAAVGEE